jgi:PAS domain S-box-containing protein
VLLTGRAASPNAAAQSSAVCRCDLKRHMKEGRSATGPDCIGNICVLSPAQFLTYLSFIFLFLAGFAFGVEPAIARNVLVLYSFSDRSVYSPSELLEAAIRTRVPGTVTFYVEYMEARRFDGNPAYEQDVVDQLQHAYGREKMDAVVVASYPALRIAVQHRDELFPTAPIVFMDLPANRIAGQKIWPGVTGVTHKIDISGTIDLALHLHPETDTVAVITENTAMDQYWRGLMQADLLGRKNLREIDFVGLPAGELLQRVSALPNHTMVLFHEVPQAAINPATGPHELLSTIKQRFPAYCIFPVECLGHGGFGGVGTDEDEQTKMAAEIVGRVLAGASPESIPVQNLTTDQVRVDWRQLHYWHIPESALPPGAVVLYRESTAWELYRRYIIAAVVVILTQSLLIAALQWQRARKRKVEAVLRESEKRFRVMANATPSLIWMCDQEGKVTYLNDRRLAFTGSDSNAGYAATWTAYVHPDDLSQILGALSGALRDRKPFSKEYRLRRNDGVYRWMFDVAVPRVNGDGSFAGFIGLAVDVTEQKLAQEGLENLSGRLIEAQERERSRIARDLHDDICQRLALLSVELAQATRNGFPPAMKERLEEMRQQCSGIAGDLQSLSHQLHSSKLDYLGVVAAIKGLCREFSKQHNVNIKFRDEDVPTLLSKDISLCFFRVTQEALQNALKYSGTDRFAVEIRGSAHEVQFEVRDDGAGFDMEEAKRSPGLGLVSMQERVHLVHGRLHIDSRPGEGTRIVVTVPVVAVESGTDARGDEATSAEGTA